MKILFTLLTASLLCACATRDYAPGYGQYYDRSYARYPTYSVDSIIGCPWWSAAYFAGGGCFHRLSGSRYPYGGFSYYDPYFYPNYFSSWYAPHYAYPGYRTGPWYGGYGTYRRYPQVLSGPYRGDPRVREQGLVERHSPGHAAPASVSRAYRSMSRSVSPRLPEHDGASRPPDEALRRASPTLIRAPSRSRPATPQSRAVTPPARPPSRAVIGSRRDQPPTRAAPLSRSRPAAPIKRPATRPIPSSRPGSRESSQRR